MRSTLGWPNIVGMNSHLQNLKALGLGLGAQQPWILWIEMYQDLMDPLLIGLHLEANRGAPSTQNLEIQPKLILVATPKKLKSFR